MNSSRQMEMNYEFDTAAVFLAQYYFDNSLFMFEAKVSLKYN